MHFASVLNLEATATNSMATRSAAIYMLCIGGAAVAIFILTKVADGTIWRVRRGIKSRNFIQNRIGVRMALGASRDSLSAMVAWVMTGGRMFV